jgi:hypothetical protein
MKVKEKVIKESIKRIEKRLKEIEELQSKNPIRRICEIRMEAQTLFEENKGDKRFESSFINKIEILSKEEQEMFKIAEKQKDSAKLIDEQVNLEIELGELKSELFYIERSKKC